MSDSDAFTREYLWKMCEQNVDQARHHETQRASVATAFIAISGALIGLVTFDRSISASDLPLTVFLTTVNLFGVVFQAKQYERFDLHMERARTYRDAVDALLPAAPIKALKIEADLRSARNHPWIGRARLHVFWTGFYLLIAIVGIALSIAALWTPMEAP